MMQTQSAKDAYRVLSEFDYKIHKAGASSIDRSRLWQDIDINYTTSFASKLNYSHKDIYKLQEAAEFCQHLRMTKDPHKISADNIYELLLLLSTYWAETPRYIFRGHGNANWSLSASWFRSEISRDIQIFQRAYVSRLKRIARRFPNVSALSPLEREAVIQHYGSGSLLLDFTTSIRVAAFFATFQNETFTEQEGCVYILDTSTLPKIGLQVLHAEDLPKEYVRIHTTRGRFLQGWSRGSDFDEQYFQRPRNDASDMKHGFVGQNGVPDPYSLELQNSLLEGGAIQKSCFLQSGDVFTDAFWRISREELDY